MPIPEQVLESAAKSIRVLHAAPLLRSPYTGGPARLEAVSVQLVCRSESYTLAYAWDREVEAHCYVNSSTRGELARLVRELARACEAQLDDLFVLELAVHACTLPMRRKVVEAIQDTGLFAPAA